MNEGRKSKKKAYIALGLVLLLALAIGTSFALFSDIVKVDNAELKSGTLDLVQVQDHELKFVRTNNTTFNITDPIAPGDSFGIAGEIKNNGTLDAKIRVTLIPNPTNAGKWTVPAVLTNETTLDAGDTLDVANLMEFTYDLGNSTTLNPNTEQNKTYKFTIKVEAMQDRNTGAGDWTNIVTVPFGQL